MDDPEPRPLLGRRLRPGELVALDCAAAAGYALVLLLSAGERVPAVPVWACAVFAVGVGLPVAVRRRWPRPVFGVVLALSLLGLVLGVTREPLLAAAFALYPVAAAGPRRRGEPTLTIGVASALGVVVAVLFGPSPAAGSRIWMLPVGAVMLGAAWTIGRAVRERRVFAARAATQLAEQAAADERLRIARELHDVVSHTLSLIGVRAGVANHVADRHPEEVRATLSLIETMSRDALAEMGQMLGVLRSGEADRLAPAPGLAALPELVERAASAGVRVELVLRVGTGLPAAVDRAAYRIVQEAVTNVVRHAGPARCRVVVEADPTEAGPTEVRVEVTDDGAGHRNRTGETGYGLIGMRERVAAHGGTIAAGPRTEGGFAVRARLPLPVREPA